MQALKPNTSYIINLRAKDNDNAYSDYATLTAKTKPPKPKVDPKLKRYLNMQYDYTRSNNTVKDNLTGLMWQDDSAVTNYTRNWQSAKNYCSNLNLAGQTDWRLPNIRELESITDHSRYNPSLHTAFQNVSSNWYWSSITYANNSSRAWIVDFYYGYSGNSVKNGSPRVRCVRSR